MSIISNVTAEPNRLEMMLAYLKSTKRQYTKQELEDIFSPSNGRGGSSVFREVYTVLESLGLVKIEDDLVKINLPNKKQTIEKTIKEAIFNKDFLERDNMAFAIAWLQTQNSIKSLNWSDSIGNVVKSDLNDEYQELDLTGTDATRWKHFGYWCIYLGFATKIYVAEKTYICPDPTNAISMELKKIFTKTKELTIKDFLISLSTILPVLEQGQVRKKINESIREGLQLSENTLSIATSLALLRLQEQQKIKLEHKSDADSVSIQNGRNNEIISHIIYLGK